MSRGGAREGAGRPSPFKGKTKPLGIRCDEQTAKRLRKEAAEEGLSLGEFIKKLLEERVKY